MRPREAQPFTLLVRSVDEVNDVKAFAHVAGFLTKAQK